ncbi:MAG: LruC domain-containing protein, partial [Bacteroidota bacterium]
ERAFNNFFPASGNGTLAFEDLWPGQGDYDFNDLVTDYRFKMVTNASNHIVEIFGTFIIKAFGASLHNGFGFQFPTTNINQAQLEASGYQLTSGYITLGSNGLENGQAKPTFILWDDCHDLMPHPGTGTGVNTTPGASYVTPETVEIYVEFTNCSYTLAQLDIGNFNPFLMVGLTRGHEVHLPDYPPTSLVDPSWFGQAQDNSIPSQGRYYKTETNLPWAISIYESFDYPKEKADIVNAYNHFVEWATSGGSSYPDWYQNKPGYRNNSLIY